MAFLLASRQQQHRLCSFVWTSSSRGVSSSPLAANRYQGLPQSWRRCSMRRRTLQRSTASPTWAVRSSNSSRSSGSRSSSSSSGSSGSSVLESEVKKFRHLQHEWWNTSSRLGTGPLHTMNAARVSFVRDECLTHIAEVRADEDGFALPLQGLRIVDVGCGGGVLSESLSRLGASVVGVDPSIENIAVAAAHSQTDPLTRGIHYKGVTVEELAERGEQFDVVAALEVIEHVDQAKAFVESLTRLVRVGGLVFVSTMNKTVKAYLMTIVGAEHIAGILPVGTHDWDKYVPPTELEKLCRERGCSLVRESGLIYNPVTDTCKLDDSDLDVNYIACFRRRDDQHAGEKEGGGAQ